MQSLCKEKKGEIVNPVGKTANKLQIFSPSTVKIISCTLFVKKRSGRLLTLLAKIQNMYNVD
jgi:hypothetical protein